MRKQDIKPGVVYAYQRYGTHLTDPVTPLVFLGTKDYGKGPVLSGELWRAPNMGGLTYAFKIAPEWAKPRAGTVHNSGSVGYPAVMLAPGGSQRTLAGDYAVLLSVTMTDFKTALSAYDTGRSIQLLVVTNLRRVTAEWQHLPEER